MIRCATRWAATLGLLWCGPAPIWGDEPVALRIQSLLVAPAHGPVARVSVRNLQARPYQGTVTLQGPAAWKIVPAAREIRLPPGETGQVDFNVERGVAVEANRYPFVVAAVAGGSRVERRQEIVCATAPYFKPVIDGDPADWKEALPLWFVVGGKRTAISTYWNRNQFCLLAAVEEDALTPYREGAAFDAVQVALASAGTKTGTSPDGESTRFEFLIAATGSGGAGRCFQLSQPGQKLAAGAAARQLAPLAYEQAAVAVSRRGKTTYYECGLPFKPMREQIPPSEGREFCLSVLVHDPDGTGLRDLGAAVGLWPQERNRLAWSDWEGAKWRPEPPFDNKIEWGLCASKY